jgi:short-subunit dehydrogenase
MTEALRWELESSNVTVCSVHPGGIKTNIVRNARLRQGPDKGVDAAQMIASFDKMARTTPEKAANVIIDGMEKREPRILIGADAHMIDTIQRLAPRKYGTWMKKLSDRLER